MPFDNGLAALIQHSDDNIYGYVPTTWICILFIVLYATSTLVHIGEAVKMKTRFMLCTVVLCGVSELIGWAARLWSSENILALTPFLMQISTTIIAPTFTAAGNFVILGSIIKRVGPQYSRLQAYSFGFIFISIDIIALVVQAIGGGIASSAPSLASNGGPVITPPPILPQSVRGGHIMLGGIVIQLVEIVVSLALSAEFFYNYYTRRTIRDLPSVGSTSTEENGDTPTEKKSWKVDLAIEHRMSSKLIIMSWALGFSSLCLLIRSIYRTIELSNGWNGQIIQTQVYFNVLDGTMVVLSMYTLNFFHPGFLLYEEETA
ncbi:RTA1-like protein [Clavulina sp. PMI_390]|nr:RTA1-like protein [Clavulina sp. PMI_390]